MQRLIIHPRWFLPVIIGLVVAQLVAGADEPRYELGTDDGQTQRAQRITAWQPEVPSLKTDDTQWLGAQPALRWILDRQADLPQRPAAWLETWTGDRLPGHVQRYEAAPENDPHGGPQLVVDTTLAAPPTDPTDAKQLRVRADCVRRIVWHDGRCPLQPGSLLLRDGRQFTFRALRWQTSSVTVLTQDGRATYALAELAELHLPAQNVWDEIVKELALLAPQAAAPLVQFETSDGLLATTCWPRQRVVRGPHPEPGDSWYLGIQPAWSRDLLWLPGTDIPVRRFYRAAELPLSRLEPIDVRQQSPLAQQGRPWQRDRNVEGQLLCVAARSAGWGFGVQASNQLVFDLPPWARSFHSAFGLDLLAADGGCVRARVLLRTGTAEQQLYASPTLVGSQQVVATGALALPPHAAPRRLVLEVDMAHQPRPPHTDPLDIRDSADWLDPLLTFDWDAAELREAIRTQTAAHIPAWHGWRCQGPATGLAFHHVWDDAGCPLRAGHHGQRTRATAVDARGSGPEHAEPADHGQLPCAHPSASQDRRADQQPGRGDLLGPSTGSAAGRAGAANHLAQGTAHTFAAAAAAGDPPAARSRPLRPGAVARPRGAIGRSGKLPPRAHLAGSATFAQRVAQRRPGHLARAMPRRHLLDAQLAEGRHGARQARGRRARQVHATDDHADRSAGGQPLHIAQRVDHAGVSTAQQHHGALGSGEIQRLVIFQQISLLALLVDIKGTARIFKVIHARHRACQGQSPTKLGRLGCRMPIVRTRLHCSARASGIPTSRAVPVAVRT